jgi:hypothetical protein
VLLISVYLARICRTYSYRHLERTRIYRVRAACGNTATLSPQRYKTGDCWYLGCDGCGAVRLGIHIRRKAFFMNAER